MFVSLPGPVPCDCRPRVQAHSVPGLLQFQSTTRCEAEMATQPNISSEVAQAGLTLRALQEPTSLHNPTVFLKGMKRPLVV